MIDGPAAKIVKQIFSLCAAGPGPTQTAKKLGAYFYEMENQTVSYTVIRRDELFSPKNQEILFTMSQ